MLSTKILCGRPRRRTQLSHVLVKRCTRVCTGMRLWHLIVEAICVNVGQVVEIEVVDVEDVRKVVEIAGHRCHSVEALRRLRPHLVGWSIHAGGYAWSGATGVQPGRVESVAKPPEVFLHALGDRYRLPRYMSVNI